MEHTQDKNDCSGPAFLRQIICQNHFGRPNRMKIVVRGIVIEDPAIYSFPLPP